MRIATALFAALVVGWAAPGSAATVTYYFSGDCAGGGCPTGASFNGILNVDDAGFLANQPVDPALISDFRVTFGPNSAGLVGPGDFQAVWGSEQGRLAALQFTSSDAVDPDTGFAMGIWLQGDGGVLGLLNGSARASLVGNCPAAGCAFPNFGDSYANYGAQGVFVPGPMAPVPLPAPFALLVGGVAVLAGLRGRKALGIGG
jgi:hypothetical protein